MGDATDPWVLYKQKDTNVECLQRHAWAMSCWLMWSGYVDSVVRKFLTSSAKEGVPHGTTQGDHREITKCKEGGHDPTKFCKIMER